MNKPLISVGILLASIALAACGNDSQPNTPAHASTAATAPTGVTQPMEPSLTPPAAAATVASYEIAPFPLSNIQICDQFASEARRCLNQVAPDDQRRAYEKDINALLQKVTPEPGQPANEWLTSDCRRGLDTLTQRYPQCAVQK